MKPTSSQPVRAAIYLRISLDREMDGLAIDRVSPLRGSVEVSPAVQGHCRLGWRLFGMAASNAGSLTNDAPWRDVTVETNRWIRWMYPVARFT